jgi:hypothetical protein
MKGSLPVAAVLGALSCSAGGTARPCPAGTSCVYGETSTFFDDNPPHAIDLLVVMDDSPSMAALQDALVARIAPLFERLPGGVPELRVRVVSSSVPASGLSSFPGCSAIGPPRACASGGGVLRATRLCGQQSSYQGSFADAFACLARVGSAGCGWEQPLAAARAALEGDPQDGTRFLRRNALLALVVVTDEDDCSAPADSQVFGPAATGDDPALAYRCQEAGVRCAGRRLSESPAGDLADCAPAPDGGGLVPVSDYVAFFGGLKTRPDQFVASVLAGWPSRYGLDEAGSVRAVRPACARNASPVLPAVRLRAFVEALGPQAQLLDLCDPSDPVEAVIRPIGEHLAVKLGYPCLPADLVDGDPARPGIQPLCSVSETRDDAPVARPLPSCEGGAPPCWRVRDEGACLVPVVDRGGCLADVPTRVKFTCATTPAG